MPKAKKLKRKAPMSIMQQFGDDERGRSLQRALQRRSGASRSAGDESNTRKYKTMRYVEGERSQGRPASYEQGGSMDMPLPESIRGDKRFQNANPKYIGKLGDTGLEDSADSGYAAGDLRFFSFYDDGFFVVDKDDNVWRTEKYYMREGETGPYYEDGEFSMDDYVKDNYGAEKFMIEGQSYIGLPEKKMAGEATGGMGASATEDLLERLNQYKRNAYGNKYQQGGVVKKKGSTIKIAGQYAVDSIKTTPQGNQYVSMELPNGEVVPVFGDWETYGNPDRESRIEDLDYIIYPLGDGTYALDAAEAEAEMLRDEARGVARGSDDVEDLMQELNQRGMRPVRRG